MKKRTVFYGSLTAALTVCFLLLGFFVFKNSYLRLKETGADLVSCVKYYLHSVFGETPEEMPSVVEYSDVSEPITLLPPDYGAFKAKTGSFFRTLFSKQNLFAWLALVGKRSVTLSKGIAIVLPGILCLWLLIKRLYAKCNNRYNRDTLPLWIYRRTVERGFLAAKRFVVGFVSFLREHGWVWIFWLVLWGFHLNLASIVVEFFAYYLFFAVSFEFGTLYVQVVKLVRDLQPFFRFFPWWILIFIPLFLFKRFRERIAFARLHHYEARNCGFIKDLPIVSITCGSMGKKKTTMITDMALSQEVMFRQKALEILQNTDLAFPHFPWICFENELLKCLEYGTVYNLATVRA